MSDEHTITGNIRKKINDEIAIDIFAEDMLIKMRENSHKAHWDTVSQRYLFDRMRDEMKELNDELVLNKSSEAIIRECADVANFAMMIADNERMKKS